MQEYIHEGAQPVFVLEGTLVLRFEDEEHVLNRGQRVLRFLGLAYRLVAKNPARAVVVTTLPRV